MPGAPETRRYLQMMTRFSSAFALLADVSMFVIGGNLKRREKISGRLGDILSMLYMASATVKRFHDEGRQKDDIPLLTWSVNDSFFKHAGRDGRRARELPQPLHRRDACASSCSRRASRSPRRTTSGARAWRRS